MTRVNKLNLMKCTAKSEGMELLRYEESHAIAVGNTTYYYRECHSYLHEDLSYYTILPGNFLSTG